MKRSLTLALLVLGMAGLLPAAATPPAVREISQLSQADAVGAGSAVTTAGALYRFSSVLDGKPVRWNPCAAIHWQFRARGAPSGGLTVAKSAVARIAQTTGTRWVYDGLVATAPTSAWLPRTARAARPVLIGWTDATASDLLRNRPRSVLGVTRTSWFGVEYNGRKYAAIRAAVIALDRTDRLPLTGPVSWRAVLLHELAHVMGLDHAGLSSQLMYPLLQRKISDLQSGDLQGLRRVGRSAGCVVVPGY